MVARINLKCLSILCKNVLKTEEISLFRFWSKNILRNLNKNSNSVK